MENNFIVVFDCFTYTLMLQYDNILFSITVFSCLI